MVSCIVVSLLITGSLRSGGSDSYGTGANGGNGSSAGLSGHAREGSGILYHIVTEINHVSGGVLLDKGNVVFDGLLDVVGNLTGDMFGMVATGLEVLLDLVGHASGSTARGGSDTAGGDVGIHLFDGIGAAASLVASLFFVLEGQDEVTLLVEGGRAGAELGTGVIGTLADGIESLDLDDRGRFRDGLVVDYRSILGGGDTVRIERIVLKLANVVVVLLVVGVLLRALLLGLTAREHGSHGNGEGGQSPGDLATDTGTGGPRLEGGAAPSLGDVAGSRIDEHGILGLAHVLGDALDDAAPDLGLLGVVGNVYRHLALDVMALLLGVAIVNNNIGRVGIETKDILGTQTTLRKSSTGTGTERPAAHAPVHHLLGHKLGQVHLKVHEVVLVVVKFVLEPDTELGVIVIARIATVGRIEPVAEELLSVIVVVAGGMLVVVLGMRLFRLRLLGRGLFRRGTLLGRGLLVVVSGAVVVPVGLLVIVSGSAVVVAGALAGIVVVVVIAARGGRALGTLGALRRLAPLGPLGGGRRGVDAAGLDVAGFRILGRLGALAAVTVVGGRVDIARLDVGRLGVFRRLESTSSGIGNSGGSKLVGVVVVIGRHGVGAAKGPLRQHLIPSRVGGLDELSSLLVVGVGRYAIGLRQEDQDGAHDADPEEAGG